MFSVGLYTKKCTFVTGTQITSTVVPSGGCVCEEGGLTGYNSPPHEMSSNRNEKNIGSNLREIYPRLTPPLHIFFRLRHCMYEHDLPAGNCRRGLSIIHRKNQ